jgi:hypothetical protein
MLVRRSPSSVMLLVCWCCYAAARRSPVLKDDEYPGLVRMKLNALRTDTQRDKFALFVRGGDNKSTAHLHLAMELSTLPELASYAWVFV